jgi:hypothetical protein
MYEKPQDIRLRLGRRSAQIQVGVMIKVRYGPDGVGVRRMEPLAGTRIMSGTGETWCDGGKLTSLT